MFHRLICSFILLAVTAHALSAPSKNEKKGPFTDDDWVAGIKKSNAAMSEDEAQAYLEKNKAKMTEIEEQFPAYTVEKIINQVDAEERNEKMRKELRKDDPSVELPESLEELRHRLVAERRKFNDHLADKNRKKVWAEDVELSPRWQEHREASQKRLDNLMKRRAEPLHVKQQKLEQRDQNMQNAAKMAKMKSEAEERVKSYITGLDKGKRSEAVMQSKGMNAERLAKIKKDAEERVKKTLENSVSIDNGSSACNVNVGQIEMHMERR
ncbi:hypothetical protein FOL47_004388 [Perkinsus chesapeaki]|uniref:Uncharacterized protein n=1 Tax=Perkinsus chesapeaki TaxID=330153 RepID=A0A7J6MZ54_PERCH|nr:hypothetical protein FOL47_004388 [Perkinsus chesapeaki]